MSTNRLCHTWLQQVGQLRSHKHITRLRNSAWPVTGKYQSRSVHLSKIVGKVPGSAKLVSVTQRSSRFLDNPSMRVRAWYEPVLRRLLECVVRTSGEVRLITDETKVGFGHQLLSGG